jgi:hypothetical protein
MAGTSVVSVIRSRTAAGSATVMGRLSSSETVRPSSLRCMSCAAPEIASGGGAMTDGPLPGTYVPPVTAMFVNPRSMTKETPLLFAFVTRNEARITVFTKRKPSLLLNQQIPAMERPAVILAA